MCNTADWTLEEACAEPQAVTENYSAFACMTHDVFISYSSRDKAASDAACHVLERNGLRCWIAPRDITAGLPYAEAIMDGIAASKVLVLIFSRHADTSAQVGREVERAISKGRTVIPFRIEDVAPSRAMEYYLSSPHWLDAFPPPLEHHLERLARNVKTLLGREATVSDVHSDPRPSAAKLRRFIWPATALIVVLAIIAVITALSVGSPRVMMQQAGPVSLGTGETRSFTIDLKRSGSVDIVITSITADWNGLEKKKSEWMAAGKGNTPELWFNVCSAAEGDKCLPGVQRGVNRTYRRDLKSGPASIQFFNYRDSPPVSFSAELSYPG